MRLQLTRRALALMLAWAWPVHAGEPGGVAARVDVYTDNRITVVSPATRGAVRVDETTLLEARYTVDAISGATPVLTVDAVSGATRFEDTRHAIGAGARVEVRPQVVASADYEASLEPDAVSHGASGRIAVEVLDRTATLAGGYRATFEAVGRDTEPVDARAMTHGLDLEWTQALDPRTRVTVLATGMVSRCDARIGCAANPYRYVAVETASGRVAVSERHPADRLRGAGAVRVARHLGDGRAVHAGYRFHEDSWSVTAHTLDLSLAQSLGGEALVLRVDGRLTHQSEAAFFRETYRTPAAEVPARRTADPELSPLWDVLAGARAEWSFHGPGPVWRTRLSVRLARLWYRYPDLAAMPSRDAWLVGGGLGAEL